MDPGVTDLNRANVRANTRSVSTASVFTLVMEGGRPSSNFLFLRHLVSFPPVFLRLWNESREIPEQAR